VGRPGANIYLRATMFLKPALTLVFIAAAPVLAKGKPAPVRKPVSASKPVVTLERQECFGSCPVYTVSLFATGAVVFEGRKYVKKMGTHRWKVKSQAVKKVQARAQSIGFFKMKDKYHGVEDGCESEVMDDASALI